MNPLSWQRGAKCRDADPTPFTADIGVGGRIPEETVYAALRYCAQCPIRIQCRIEADDAKTPGLWGAVFRVENRHDPEYVTYDVLAGEQPRRRRGKEVAA